MAVAQVGDALRLAQDVVIDDAVEFLIRLVRNRQEIIRAAAFGFCPYRNGLKHRVVDSRDVDSSDR
jgi:hypothetical protein